MTKEVPRTSVLRDEELIAYLRLQGLDKDIAADRIEALVKERDSLLAGHRALNIGGARLQDRAEAAEARAERLEAVLRELIDHTHNCEKELTERLYRADFCGESLPLTNARAALNNTR